MTGDRPPRPESARWLRDQVWDTITECWSEQRGQRWDIRSVYDQLSFSSIQEAVEGELGAKDSRESSIRDFWFVLPKISTGPDPDRDSEGNEEGKYWTTNRRRGDHGASRMSLFKPPLPLTQVLVLIWARGTTKAAKAGIPPVPISLWFLHWRLPTP